MKATATIGPWDYPQPIRVTILGRDRWLPDFFVCQSEDGERLTIRRHKLESVPWMATVRNLFGRKAPMRVRRLPFKIKMAPRTFCAALSRRCHVDLQHD